MNKILITLIFLLFSCRSEGPIIAVEAINEGDYYISNKSSFVLFLEAYGGSDYKFNLDIDQIKPDSVEKFFTFIEGSGGHTYPSNAFDKFYLLIIDTLDSKKIVYDKVYDDKHWVENENFGQKLTLVINDSILNL